MSLWFSRPFVSSFAIAGLVAMSLSLGAKDASAQVVYDNGSFATTVAFNLTSFIHADDFTLPANASFDSIRFWYVDAFPGLTPRFSGTLTWTIWTNGVGIPGTPVTSGTSTIFTIGPTGFDLGDPDFEIAQIDFSIPQVTLSAGTYWLSLKENGPTDPDDGSPIFWVQSTSQTGNAAHGDSNEAAPATWAFDEGGDAAFQLRSSIVVPEPGTFALLGLGTLAASCLGLLPLAGRLARRKRVSARRRVVLPKA